MYDRLEALEAKVRLLQQQIAPLLPKPEPPPVVAKEVDVAQREYDAAAAYIKVAQDKAAADVKAAEDQAKLAKAVLDKSQAESKPPEQPAAAARRA